MKKLLILSIIISSIGIFSSCDEEQITPKDNSFTKGEHSQSEDPGQWE